VKTRRFRVIAFSFAIAPILHLIALSSFRGEAYPSLLGGVPDMRARSHPVAPGG